MRLEEAIALEDAHAASQDDELSRVLADYLAEVEAGRAVDPLELIEKHPAIADRLRTCLKGLHMVEEFACSIGAGSPARDASALDGPTLGDFRIVRTLGRGGMGVVYEAVQRSLERRVALKVLPFGAAIDPRRLARFRVESHAAAQLNHPHIISVYSVGSEAGVHYYAMQLIDGPTLAELIADLRRLKELDLLFGAGIRHRRQGHVVDCLDDLFGLDGVLPRVGPPGHGGGAGAGPCP